MWKEKHQTILNLGYLPFNQARNQLSHNPFSFVNSFLLFTDNDFSVKCSQNRSKKEMGVMKL